MLTRSLAFHEFTVKYYFNNWVWNTQKKKPSNFWPNKGNRARAHLNLHVHVYLSSSVVPAASSSAVDSVDSVLCMDVSWSAVLAQTRPPSPASLDTAAASMFYSSTRSVHVFLWCHWLNLNRLLHSVCMVFTAHQTWLSCKQSLRTKTPNKQVNEMKNAQLQFEATQNTLFKTKCKFFNDWRHSAAHGVHTHPHKGHRQQR